MNKWLYGFLCLLPAIVIISGIGVFVLLAQDHQQRDCLRFVSSHVTTDAAAWKKLVCHG